MPKTTLICLLDKHHPPDHSFVTGMLAQALPERTNVRVQLLVMKSNGRLSVPVRYHRAVSLPVMPDLTRSDLSKLSAFSAIRRITAKLINKARRRGDRVVLFVRNHPILALIADTLNRSVDAIIFQSSYPLNESHGSCLKRWAHRSMLRFGNRHVTGLLAVSPLGLERAKALCSQATQSAVVPLLADLAAAHRSERKLTREKGMQQVRFVYLGTHKSIRRLDVVLKGATRALDTGVQADFCFVGGTPTEIAKLVSDDAVARWEERRRIRFVSKVPRSDIPNILADADVGLSLIPSNRIFREASPTKLAEYLGAGLAVLASHGVTLQEEFMSRSAGGALVDFEPEAIANGIRCLVVDREYLRTCQLNASKFAQEQLQYCNYVPDIEALIACTR